MRTAPEPEEQHDPPRDRRLHSIELVQLGSVMALAGAWGLTRIPVSVVLPILAAILGIALFFIAYLMVPEPADNPGYPRSKFGFKLTKRRLRTLKELGVPDDILEACIDPTILGECFQEGEDLREALYDLLGEERVRPYARTILLHARLYRDPPSQPPGKPAKPQVDPDLGLEDMPLHEV